MYFHICFFHFLMTLIWINYFFCQLPAVCFDGTVEFRHFTYSHCTYVHSLMFFWLEESFNLSYKVFHEIIYHQKRTVSIVRYCTIYTIRSWLSFTEVADSCLSWYSCLEKLVEPEIVLVFKDKLKASDLGYQLKEREKKKCGAAVLETSHLLLSV